MDSRRNQKEMKASPLSTAILLVIALVLYAWIFFGGPLEQAIDHDLAQLTGGANIVDHK